MGRKKKDSLLKIIVVNGFFFGFILAIIAAFLSFILNLVGLHETAQKLYDLAQSISLLGYFLLGIALILFFREQDKSD